MALKYVIDTLEEVDATLRPHYVPENGKFSLATQGEHPKVTEFRSSNVELLKERDTLKAKYADIDPDAVKADRVKLAELQNAKPTERIAELETQLAAEKKARTDAEQQANKSRVRDVLRVKAVAAGVLPAALEILLDKAIGTFTIDGDSVVPKANIFSPTRPGERLTPDEWMATAIKDFAFLFGASAGGGAGEHRSGGGSAANELRDPTPQQLGQYAREIKSGALKVVYTGGQK
jgi:hypothetical protein